MPQHFKLKKYKINKRNKNIKKTINQKNLLSADTSTVHQLNNQRVSQPWWLDVLGRGREGWQAAMLPTTYVLCRWSAVPPAVTKAALVSRAARLLEQC